MANTSLDARISKKIRMAASESHFEWKKRVKNEKYFQFFPKISQKCHFSSSQQKNLNGMDLIRGIITGYEIQVNLVKGICLHEHKIDHIAHLGPSVAAGLGSLLKLDTETIYQSIQQALHTTISTRQSRKGQISSWKAFAPSHAGKLAIEAVDRAMRGEGSPSPIYEGEDSVIAYVLSGSKAKYIVPLPKVNEEKKAILETYTKEHSAEYQAQAWIDLARSLNKKIKNISNIKKIDITQAIIPTM